MHKTSRRRVAAVATTATMGGLLLPFLASGVALAAGPTSLTVNPTSAYTTSGGSATFDVTLNGGAAVAGSDIYMRTDTGPDAATLGTICTQTSTTLYSCKVTNNAAQPPGTDALRFYYSPTGVYAAGEPTTTASLTIAGAVNQVTLTPTMSSAAQGGYAQYSVSATDAKGQPVPGATVTITATQAGAVNAPGAVGTPQPATDDLVVTGTDPMGATLTPTTAAAVANSSATAKTTVTTADGTGSTVAGQGKFYVASKVSGTVNLSIAGNTAGTASAAGTLTVNPGGINDVKSVTVSPAAQRAFTTTAGDAETASVVVNLRNAQGNPVSGVTPTVVVTSGPDAGPVAVTGTSDAKGNVTVTYPTSVNSGTDTVEAYVNYTNNNGTTGLDAGEPSGTATVVVAPFNVKSVTASPKTVIVPLSQNAATLTYTVATTDGSSPQGYNVVFSVNPTDTKYTLSAPSAVTDANGKASVTLTNSKPVDGDSPVVTGTVGSATKSQSDSATVKYQASAVTSGNIKITPFANTTAAKGTASFSASATDQFGNPVTGVVYNWSVSGRNNIQNNNGALGTGPTFSYTDVGPSGSQGTDMVTVQATTASGGTVTVNSSDTADQYWVTTNAAATQANIDLGVDGTYTENRAGVPFGQTGPIVPSGFKTTITTGVTNNPTADKPVTPTPVRVKLTDAANNRLYGKSVSFSSTGVGGFTDAKGNPLGTSATALVADQTAINGESDKATLTADYATVYVRSTQSGTQNITATVDGITTNASVVYTGEYVAITPDRVADTRTGQGGIFGTNGGIAPAGPLAANTSYGFNYAATQMPLNAAAYVFNVTAITPNGVGNLRVAPTTFEGQSGGITSAAPSTALITYQPGKDVANLAIVPNPSGSNVLQLFSAASSANVTIDLVGYYPTEAGITPITPTRIADTRDGAGSVKAGETRSFQVAGQAKIPAAASASTPAAKAVALNVSVVNPSNLGNLRIFADGVAVPTTSNINYIPGQDKSATVIVDLPADGKISVYSAGAAVDVVIDAYAYYDTNTSLVTQTPSRILDTRTSTPIAAGGSTDVQVTGQAGVPADAQAVLVSVTGIHTTGSTGSGNLRIYPAGGTLPNFSTLNYVSPTSDVANFSIVKLGANGKVTLNSQGSPIDATVDVVGYVPAGGLAVNLSK